MLAVALVLVAQISYTIAPRHIDDQREFGHRFIAKQRCSTPKYFFTERNLRMINVQPQIADTQPKEQLARACHTEAELIRCYGSHTLAFFGLAPENEHFLV